MHSSHNDGSKSSLLDSKMETKELKFTSNIHYPHNEAAVRINSQLSISNQGSQLTNTQLSQTIKIKHQSIIGENSLGPDVMLDYNTEA